MTVLALLMTTSLIVVALLSVTVDSMATFAQQKASSKEIRVADSALESAVNSIRMDSTGALGSSDPCDTGIGTVNIDGLDADVSCEVEPSDPLPLEVPATSPGATNSLKVVGDTYGGSVPWATNCAPLALGPGCFPWKDAVGAPNYGDGSTLGAYPATLVHSGPEPLRVAGGVVVRQGAAVLLNPTDGGPGLTVGGDFTQYEKGPYSAQGGGECGLSGYTHPWNVAAARVQDLDVAPLCNPVDNPSTATVDESLAIDETAGLNAPANAFPPAPKANAWMPTVASPKPVTSVARTVPNCSGSVLTFEPGSYNSTQTAILNGYLASDTDGCDGKTFWFKPGDYWFDSNSAGGSLTIADGTALLVFGEPSRAAIKTAGANPSDFPKACDPTKPGVSITLSPRTGLIHQAGRVAICDTTAGESNSGAPPAVWQTAWADGGWTASPGEITELRTESWGLVFGGVATRNGTNLNGAKVANDGQVANAPLGCNLAFCQGEVYLSVQHMGAADLAGNVVPAPGSAPISWAQLLISGNSNDANDMESLLPGAQAVANTQIRVFLRDTSTGVVASSATCGGQYQAINETPDANSTLVYDLLAEPQSPIGTLPSCRALVTDRGQLVDARIDIQFHVNSKCSSCGDNWRVRVDGVAIRTGWDLRATRATDPITGTFGNPARVASPDNQSANSRFECSFWVLDGCGSGWRNIVLHELGNPEVPDLPSGSLTTAGVVVKGAESRGWTDILESSAYPKIWDHSKMRLTLSNLAGGGSCAVEYLRTPAWRQSVYLDLLNPSAGQVGSTPRCSAVLTDPSQLVGSDLKLDVYLERDGWAISDQFGILIDYIGLTTTSGAYTGPTSANQFTSNATSSSSGASFNSYGAVSVARNSLDVSWEGPATPDPLVTGDLVVRALGSEMTPTAKMGVLCCSPSKPSERRVALKAVVDGRLRASAVVRFGDAEGGVWNPGRSVVVEDWKLCKRPSASATCSA